MATQSYVAIIERGAEGFGAFFPDFPGCVSAGDTIQETVRNAEEALRGHVAAMTRDGDTIPNATALDDIPADPDVTEAARVMVQINLSDHDATPQPDPDNPEWTKEDFRQAKPASELPAEIRAAFPKTPQKQKPGHFSRGLRGR